MSYLKRSRFLDDMGIPKTDLRTKPKCACCGIAITRKNWGHSITKGTVGSWGEVIYYCDKDECMDYSVKND